MICLSGLRHKTDAAGLPKPYGRHMDRDVLAACALGTVAISELAFNGVDHRLVWLCAPVMAASIAFRRRAPLMSALTAYAAFAAPLLLGHVQMPALGDPPNSYAIAGMLLVAVYTAGSHPILRRAVVGLLGAELVMVSYLLLSEPVHPSSVNDVIAAGFVPTVVPWLAGVLVARQQRLRAAEREADDLRIAAAEERTRIAREVHDLVAHSVSLMVVQAEAGEALLESAPGRTAESLRAVQQAGREALGEMRRTVSALRTGTERGGARGLASLPALVETMRSAGLPVTVVATGVPTLLAPDVDESTYRLVSEALTNSLRHSDHRGVIINIRYEPDGLDLRVVDVGRPVRRRLPGGHGLVGIRESIASLGGRFDVGVTEAGEHVVHATLPLKPAT